eukprot:1728908-Rhodomonas_salina.2
MQDDDGALRGCFCSGMTKKVNKSQQVKVRGVSQTQSVRGTPMPCLFNAESENAWRDNVAQTLRDSTSSSACLGGLPLGPA